MYSTIWVKQPAVHTGRKDSSGFQSINIPISDQYFVFCKACSKPFSIIGSGIGQVKSHHGSRKHLERMNILQNGKQRTFTSGENGQMTLKKSIWSLTEKEKDIECRNLASTT